MEVVWILNATIPVGLKSKNYTVTKLQQSVAWKHAYGTSSIPAEVRNQAGEQSS